MLHVCISISNGSVLTSSVYVSYDLYVYVCMCMCILCIHVYYVYMCTLHVYTYIMLICSIHKNVNKICNFAYRFDNLIIVFGNSNLQA